MKYNVVELENGVSLIKVDNEISLKLELCTLGAGVYSLKLNDKNLILTHKDIEDYMVSSQFYGKTLGVVAGRLKGDGLILGNEYHLLKESGKEFSLHGGKMNSISFKNWKYKIKESNKKLDVTFNCETKNNENGFPGKLRVYVTYEISKIKDEFKILFKATTPSEATFVNLSNHMYFNFNDTLNINDYYLKMNCSKIATTDETLLINGFRDVDKNTDYHKMSKLNPRLDYLEKHDFKKTIDDTWLFDEEKVHKVILKNKEITLTLLTDYDAINIYADSSMTPVNFINRDDFTSRRAIALEPQTNVYDKNKITLKKGDIYKHFIQYKFKENN